MNRQDTPFVYDMNASIYLWWVNTLRENKSLFNENTAIYEMPKERSIDIDDRLDFEFAEMLMKKRSDA